VRRNDMTAEPEVWRYTLAPDVSLEEGAWLATATTHTEVAAGDLQLIQCLDGSAHTESELCERLHTGEEEEDVEIRCAAILFRLDRLGLLAREVWSGGRRLASCVPRRPAADPLPAHPPDGALRLSSVAFARRAESGVTLDAPTSWATLTIHDRRLMPILHDLTLGTSADAMVAAAPSDHAEAVRAVVRLIAWCGLLDTGEPAWPPHELLFHSRTRRGYTRARLGRIHARQDTSGAIEWASATGADRIVLEPPDLNRLVAADPPFALVAERRRSTRRYGALPLTSGQLSELLFRTLHERGGRRPYPSGGSCYPLQGYLAVHRCGGIAQGLYAYDAVRHELVSVAEPGAALDALLMDAAAAAGIVEAPQVLLVLVARPGGVRHAYGDLSYSLILKEVGAVFQAAMMAGAAMSVGTCPLGCGDSLLFAELARLDMADAASVGELMIGSLEAPTS
jgi:SagB-type dehydrogenase family enzyme